MSTLIDDGPDGYWSPDLPPSRGQMAAIAVAACRLLDIPEPRSRLEASEILVRLRLAKATGPSSPPPVVEAF